MGINANSASGIINWTVDPNEEERRRLQDQIQFLTDLFATRDAESRRRIEALEAINHHNAVLLSYYQGVGVSADPAAAAKAVIQ